MALTTNIARHYAIRNLVIGLLCAVFGVWGVYDFFWKIPAQTAEFDRWEALLDDKKELEDKANAGGLSTDERQRAGEIEAELNEFDGQPEKPARLDHIMQWGFIACLPFAPYYFWVYLSTRRQVYQLDDEGALHLPEVGAWARDEISDIDMSRWMKKSIAWVIHTDGTRVKIDDYKHRNAHLIIGAIAHRMYPEQWEIDAKAVKGDDDEETGPVNGALPQSDDLDADEASAAVEDSSSSLGD